MSPDSALTRIHRKKRWWVSLENYWQGRAALRVRSE